MLILAFLYLLVGLVLLLRPANVREWITCTDELHDVYWPRTPGWVIGLLLALLFLLIWPLAIRITRK